MSIVMELQRKLFPIKHRGNLMASEIRNAINFLSLFPQEKTTDESKPKLQEPRELYSAASLLHPPKWPIECQVIPDKIRHLNLPIRNPEPFYTTTNSEPQPQPVGIEMGTLIYDYNPKLSVDYYCRSYTGGSQEEFTIYPTDELSLNFESRFESGNLAKVIKITNVYYELYLRPDMYTDRHAQWYYFRIKNTRENIVYRFSIVNLSKTDSLYRYGMKPLIYSEKDAQLNGIGWTRTGQNISYYKNDITASDNSSFYTLTFNLKFNHSNDSVYIAQCYPYTYTNLQSYLQEIQSDRNKARLCQQRLLCKSLAGNNVYVLTITAPDTLSQDEDYQVKKPAIVLTARVHPGETPSSYMMKGIIDFLISDSSHAQELRDRFIFKLIPMLNPDGVIVGNSRCCLLGQDLNRQYRTVLREAFPQIYQTKILLRRLVDENGIFLYCDIHGHSRRNNVFMYGCENRRIPEKKLTEQIFPLMMHKNAADKFSFSNCKFRIQKSKEGTGRIFVWTLGVANSYTLEISLGGSTLVSREHTHFNYVDYEDIGRHFCETLLDYSDTNISKEKMRQKILTKLIKSGSSADEPINIPISDYSSLSHSDTEDDESDTTEDDDELDFQKTKVSLLRQSSLRQSKSKKIQNDNRYPLRKNSNSGKRVKKYLTVESNISDDEKSGSSSTCKKSPVFGRFKKSTVYTSIRYTNLLFEDPFQPPDIIVTSKEEGDDGVATTAVDTETQTEDECDQTDTSGRYPSDSMYEFRTKGITAGLQNLSLLTKATRSKFRSCKKSTSTLEIRQTDEMTLEIKSPNLQLQSPSKFNSLRRGSLSTLESGKRPLKMKQSQSTEDLGERLYSKIGAKSKFLCPGTGSGSNTRKSFLSIQAPAPCSTRRVSWAGGSSIPQIKSPITPNKSLLKKSKSLSTSSSDRDKKLIKSKLKNSKSKI